jgi:hypothetical protein
LEERINSALQNEWAANVQSQLRELRKTSLHHRDEMIETL